jgi:hypothetical protein
MGGGGRCGLISQKLAAAAPTAATPVSQPEAVKVLVSNSVSARLFGGERITKSDNRGRCEVLDEMVCVQALNEIEGSDRN